MKKILYSILFLFLIILFANANDGGYYKVVKIVDGDTFYVDLNNNGIAEKDERIRVNGIDTFETKINNGLNWQMKLNHIDLKEALGLGYLAKNYAESELLNKYVLVEYSSSDLYDHYGRRLASIYYDCNKKGLNCKNYEKEVLKQGLAKVYNKSNLADSLYPFYNKEKLKENVEKTKKLNLYFYDYKDEDYVDITSPRMVGYGEVELVNKKGFKYYD